MSGHSKWSSIKHKKAIVDSRRGKMFSKLIKEITIAARTGGGDLDANPRLRTAIATARAANMPMDNISRAIKKGTGELPGESYEDYSYEGYGPGGVALLVDVTTDNRNRTVAEIRYILSKHGGSMGEAGCVAWMFEKKGLVILESPPVTADELLDIVLEAGAEDLKVEGSTYEIISDTSSFEAVKEALEAKELTPAVAEIAMIPKTEVKIEDESAAKKLLNLLELLEDHDDVRKVWANFDIPDKILEAVG